MSPRHASHNLNTLAAFPFQPESHGSGLGGSSSSSFVTTTRNPGLGAILLPAIGVKDRPPTSCDGISKI